MEQQFAQTKILMLGASPRDLARLRLDHELREIEEGLKRRSRLRDSFQLIPKVAVRPRDVQRALLDHAPQIVHFSGHGEGETGLALEDDAGKVIFVDAAALAELFKLFKPQCVVLNACYSQVQAEAIAQHIPYVIGMGDQIGDTAAIAFAVAFYDALGAGCDIEFAYENACIAIRLEGLSQYNVPILLKKSSPIPPPTSFLAHPSTPPPTHSFFFSTYNPKTWTGRDQTISHLTETLNDGCRLLIIHGLTGIGKTALAERLTANFVGIDRVGAHVGAQGLAPLPEFPLPYCRVVFDHRDASPGFAQGAIRILQALGDDTAQTISDDKLLPYLLKALEHPHWLQIDSAEYLLDTAGQCHFHDAAWVEFFFQFLTSPRIQSRIIFTTQALPADLVERIEREDQLWHEFSLRGLEAEHWLTLFHNYGVEPQTEGEIDHLCHIGHYFDGHPLILKMIAGDIRNPLFGGSVETYWRTYYSQRDTAPKIQKSQEQRARNWVRQIIEQLPDAPRQMLKRSAVYRRPVPEAFYLQQLDATDTDRTAALTTLKLRNLVEEDAIENGQLLIRQHNLIRDVAYDQLKANTPIWETANRTAAHLWLTAYTPAPDSPKLEKVRGYLESSEHYCEVEDWEETAAIMLTRLNFPPKEEMHYQLDIWGFHRELVSIIEKLSGKLDNRRNSIFMNRLGWSHHLLGNNYLAKEIHQENLRLTHLLDEHDLKTNALNGLAKVHYSLEEYEHAENLYNKSLELNQKHKDKLGEARALNGLGFNYVELGKIDESIRYCKLALEIFRDFKDYKGEADALKNIGNSYRFTNHIEDAAACYEACIKIVQKTGDVENEVDATYGLGACFFYQKNYIEAINYASQSLIISQHIYDRWGEGNALWILGSSYFKLNQYGDAIEHLSLALDIFNGIGKRSYEAEIHKELAELYCYTNQLDMAREACDQALVLAIELGIPLVEECRALKAKLDEEAEKTRDF